MSNGNKVKYSEIIDPSDSYQIFTILEIDEAANWCRIQADVDMNFRPTYTANLSDLKIA
jgi:hypothetical protein